MSRGGKRFGSGRPIDPNKKQPYSTRIRPDLIEWLKGQKNATKEIETALDNHISKPNK